MDANFINSFISAATFVISEETKCSDITRGNITKDITKFASEEVNIVIGITGDLEGTAIFSCTQETAIQMVSKIIDASLTEFNDSILDGIAEMSNVITGRATILLEQNGFASNLSPPTTVLGVGSTISTSSLMLISVPLNTENGVFTIKIGFKD